MVDGLSQTFALLHLGTADVPNSKLCAIDNYYNS